MKRLLAFLVMGYYSAFAQRDTASVYFSGIPAGILFTGMSGAYADTTKAQLAPGFIAGWAMVSTGQRASVSETCYLLQAYRTPSEGYRQTYRIHYLLYHEQYRKYGKQKSMEGLYAGVGWFLSVRIRERAAKQAAWWLIPYMEAGATGSAGKQWALGRRHISAEIRGSKPLVNLLRGFRNNPLYTVGFNVYYLF